MTCHMDFSSFAGQTKGERNRGPDMIREVFEYRAESDSSMTTSVESVQDGLGDGPARVGRRGYPSRLGDTIYEPLARYKLLPGNRRFGVADAQATRRISPATRSSTGSTVSAFAGSRLKTRRATPASR